MKKSNLNEVQRMQQLAGIVKESQLNENKNNIIFDELWGEQSKEYLDLVGTDPIYDGLDKVVNDPRTMYSALKWAQELADEDEDDDDMFGAYAQDGIDYEIMQRFAPQLARNLVRLGFNYNSDDTYWTVPPAYLDKLNDSTKKEYQNGATSYGIIWDFFNYDYDTSPREIIGDYLDKAAQEM